MRGFIQTANVAHVCRHRYALIYLYNTAAVNKIIWDLLCTDVFYRVVPMMWDGVGFDKRAVGARARWA